MSYHKLIYSDSSLLSKKLRKTVFKSAIQGTERNMPITPYNAPPIVMDIIMSIGFKPILLPIILGAITDPSIWPNTRRKIVSQTALIGLIKSVIITLGTRPISDPKYGTRLNIPTKRLISNG